MVLNHTIDLSPMREREEGFRSAMAAAGHAVPDERVCSLPFHADCPAEVARLVAEVDADAERLVTDLVAARTVAAAAAAPSASDPRSPESRANPS